MNSLFLSEAASTQEATVATITLEEAYVGLLEFLQEGAVLTEAILVGDYTLTQRSGKLSEDAALVEQENFMTRVAGHVKAFIIKAKERIVQFLQMVAAKIKSVYAKVTAGKPTISVPKGALKGLNDLVASLKNLDTAARSGEKNVKTYKAGVDKAAKVADAVAIAARKGVVEGKAKKSYEEVQVSGLSGIQAAANEMAALAKSAEAVLSAAVKDAEEGEKVATKAASKVKDDAAKADKKAAQEAVKEAQAKVSLARAHTDAYGKVAHYASAVNMLVAGIVAVRTTPAAA